VLTLTRDTRVVPNPKGDRELEAGDRLLCFGRLEEMRDLVPARRRRRARPVVEPLPPEAAEALAATHDEVVATPPPTS